MVIGLFKIGAKATPTAIKQLSRESINLVDDAAAAAKKVELSKVQELIGVELNGIRNGVAITKPMPCSWNNNVKHTDFYKVIKEGDDYAVQYLKGKTIAPKASYSPLGSEIGYAPSLNNAAYTRQRADIFPALGCEGKIFGRTQVHDANGNLLYKELTTANRHPRTGYMNNYGFNRVTDSKVFNYGNNTYSRAVELDYGRTLGNGNCKGYELGILNTDGIPQITNRVFKTT